MALGIDGFRPLADHFRVLARSIFQKVNSSTSVSELHAIDRPSIAQSMLSLPRST